MSSPAPPSPATQLRQRLRPWPQFFDLSAISIPISLSDTTYRINQNLRYFFPNYALIFLITLFLSLVYHPISLVIFLIISAGWIFLYFSRNRDDPLVLFNYEIDDKIILGFLGLLTLLALIFAKVWKNVFVSLAIGVLILLIHGSLRAPEEDLESPYGSLLSDVTSPQGDYTMV
ncbi:OLC1v1019847C1 [Oldenlandia corymbosa var. corymbosa]|uniref:PRA1 family protein n=1 Tax=Oldenlandia corymbosa var. corymbosa TaxID=529605 RepID=A0AAV1EEW8_OLDCO|nr:OLC1v1019847C1 [Oldenlandia corymbosa var. corymbosa]